MQTLLHGHDAPAHPTREDAPHAGFVVHGQRQYRCLEHCVAVTDEWVDRSLVEPRRERDVVCPLPPTKPVDLLVEGSPVRGESSRQMRSPQIVSS